MGAIRVVIAKPGLDGHDRGAKVVARVLRDAGVEVIYTGLHQTPEQIVETVIQEDADAVGLSILSGAHMTLVPRIIELLHAQAVDDVLVTVEEGAIMGGADRPISVTAKHPGCYTYSIGACTAGTIYGMCGNADTQLIVSAN